MRGHVGWEKRGGGEGACGAGERRGGEGACGAGRGEEAVRGMWGWEEERR